VRGPGWVDPLPPQPHPKSALVVLIPDVVALFTPCHGECLFFSPGKARRDVVLSAACPGCGRTRQARLVADESAEFGLRADWDEAAVSGG